MKWRLPGPQVPAQPGGRPMSSAWPPRQMRQPLHAAYGPNRSRCDRRHGQCGSTYRRRCRSTSSHQRLAACRTTKSATRLLIEGPHLFSIVRWETKPTALSVRPDRSGRVELGPAPARVFPVPAIVWTALAVRTRRPIIAPAPCQPANRQTAGTDTGSKTRRDGARLRPPGRLR